jgi:hypothetical protein
MRLARSPADHRVLSVSPVLVERCNCESSYCEHAHRPCPVPASSGAWMLYVGHVCAACADVARANGGADLILSGN